MMEKLEAIKNGWYGRLEDLVEEIEELGLDVEESNMEYITASYEDDDETVFVDIRIGGTERTIAVESIREVERI